MNHFQVRDSEGRDSYIYVKIEHFIQFCVQMKSSTDNQISSQQMHKAKTQVMSHLTIYLLYHYLRPCSVKDCLFLLSMISEITRYNVKMCRQQRYCIERVFRLSDFAHYIVPMPFAPFIATIQNVKLYEIDKTVGIYQTFEHIYQKFINRIYLQWIFVELPACEYIKLLFSTFIFFVSCNSV